MSSAARKIKRNGGRIRLSLCMIVKNEEETLEQCLSTARPHVDEIVIVDTGSSDSTPEISRRYADVYDEIEWPDSFSIARNHSFSFATGEYIIVLDGDEFLPDPQHWNRIRKALAGPNVATVQILIRNLLPEGQIVAADRMWQERVVRNDARIRYTGRVHNQLYDGLKKYVAETGAQVARASAEVIHTGYAHASDRMQEKYSTRLHLLEEEYATSPTPGGKAYYGHQLGVTRYVLEHFEQALDVFGALEYDHLSPQNAFYTHMLAAQAALKCELPARALTHCNAMLTLDRGEPIAYYITGLALVQARKLSDGLLMLMEAFQTNSRIQQSRFMLSTTVLMRILARICRGSGLSKHAEAFSELESADDFDPLAAASIISSLRLGLVQADRAAA